MFVQPLEVADLTLGWSKEGKIEEEKNVAHIWQEISVIKSSHHVKIIS